MSPIHVYRVRQSKTHPDRRVRNAWYGRTWQAEWEGSRWSPRAWTERGIRRKANRWYNRGEAWWAKNHSRHVWVRMHITQRSDPYYAQRRAIRIAARRGGDS